MNTSTTASARALLVAAAVIAGAGAADAQPTARTEAGTVTGVSAEDMNEFLGIRYAAPPIGALRWQPPQPVPAGLATTSAAAFGPHCAQLPSPYGVASTSEDCLFLNVYTPTRAPRARSAGRPVMVWIHGGALVVGESDLYDPVKLVTDGDVIVVTINYRLGYLGYLAESGLDAEGHAAANYGLMDQQAALGWVRRNIEGFGGDPDRVTIFGESAGGQSVLSNLVSPAAAGLFSRAIVESGAYALRLPNIAQAETAGAAFAAALGCAAADTACLRAAPVAAVLARQTSPTLSLTGIVDGAVLPLSINTALQSGRFNGVPVMNGSNHDEYRLFLPAYAGLTGAQYPGVLDATFGPALGQAVAAQYPAAAYAQPVLALAAAITDQSFACPARLVDLWTAARVRTYAYEFNDERAPEDFLPPSGYPFGAAHASEIQFLFDIPELPGTPKLSRSETALSRQMVDYWTSFAHDGSPDDRGASEWAPYALAEANIQSLAAPRATEESDFAQTHHCAFWAPVIDPPAP